MEPLIEDAMRMVDDLFEALDRLGIEPTDEEEEEMLNDLQTRRDALVRRYVEETTA